MVDPGAVEVRNALDELVNQFADPMSFLRELIQNAVDAGSEEVEVRVLRQSGEGTGGVTVIHVDDWGEGMTREIIAKRLTRLFSSAKDGDMTKIGKFGIGFVSVFAIQPEAVCVDTAREGESWRVLFDDQRRFKLIRRDEPVDGTKIRIYKKSSEEEHEHIVGRARGVLAYWCKHIAADIRFDGKLVGQPFALPDSVASVEQKDGLSHIVVGHCAQAESFAGFYNSGLTLIESKDRLRPGIAYKVNSPHLEHTLTRDAVIHDAGHARVMAQVETLLAGPLCELVLQRLSLALRGGDDRDLAGLLQAVTRHLKMDHLGSRGDAVIALSPAGMPVTVDGLGGGHDDDEILLAGVRSQLTDALEKRGSTVVLEPPDTLAAAALRDLLAALAPGIECHSLAARYCQPVVLEAMSSAQAALAQAVDSVFEAEGLKVGAVAFASFDYPGSGIGDRVAIALPKLGEIASIADAVALKRGLFSRSRAVAVNAAHPSVTTLVVLAAHEPELAGYLLVKQFLLGHHLDAALDSRIAAAGMEARWRRSMR